LEQQTAPQRFSVLGPNGWHVLGITHAGWLPHLHVGTPELMSHHSPVPQQFEPQQGPRAQRSHAATHERGPPSIPASGRRQVPATSGIGLGTHTRPSAHRHGLATNPPQLSPSIEMQAPPSRDPPVPLPPVPLPPVALPPVPRPPEPVVAPPLPAPPVVVVVVASVVEAPPDPLVVEPVPVVPVVPVVVGPVVPVVPAEPPGVVESSPPHDPTANSAGVATIAIRNANFPQNVRKPRRGT
jgi:signal-induced proliferation-associated 1 like protein 3